MANLNNSVWYIDSVQWTAVTSWAATTSYAVGTLRRQSAAPTVGNERVFVQANPTTHTSGGSEPTWVVTRYGATTDGTCTWYECTGNPATNGDLTNALTWAQQHASSTTITAGLIIYDSVSGSLQICTTGATIGGSAPSFSATAGTTTADNTATWTSLGAASNFQYWKAPHARLGNALIWGAGAGTIVQNIYVGDDSAETQAAAINYNQNSGIFQCFCIDHTANLPPTGSNLKTSATITTTGANGISFSANSTAGLYYYLYGISINVGTGSSAANFQLANWSNVGVGFILEAGSINLLTTSASSTLQLAPAGVGPAPAKLINSTVSFGATGQSIQFNDLTWDFGSITGATIPTTLLKSAGTKAIAQIRGVDLSAAGSGKTLVSASNLGCIAQILNCKLGASVTIASTPTAALAGGTDLIVSDSAATGYRQERYRYEGTLTASTAVYNNASDGDTPISWQVVTTANASRADPFECIDIVQWVVAGTYAASLIQITSANAGLLNSDVWVEASYLGNASFPISSMVSSAPANLLTAGSSLAAGTWVTGGLGNNYKLAIPSFTQAIDGDVRFKVKVAKASLTVNIDPAVTIA